MATSLMLEHQAQEQDGSSHSLDAELDSGPMDISHRKGATLCMKAQGDHPPAFLGPWCAEQGRPGVDMAGWEPGGQKPVLLSVPRTSPVTSTAPILGSCRLMAGCRRAGRFLQQGLV